MATKKRVGAGVAAPNTQLRMEYSYKAIDRVRLRRDTENAAVILGQVADGWIVDVIQPGGVRSLRRARYSAARAVFRAELRRAAAQGWE